MPFYIFIECWTKHARQQEFVIASSVNFLIYILFV
jgi:hypothetical protein